MLYLVEVFEDGINIKCFHRTRSLPYTITTRFGASILPNITTALTLDSSESILMHFPFLFQTKISNHSFKMVCFLQMFLFSFSNNKQTSSNINRNTATFAKNANDDKWVYQRFNNNKSTN